MNHTHLLNTWRPRIVWFNGWYLHLYYEQLFDETKTTYYSNTSIRQKQMCTLIKYAWLPLVTKVRLKWWYHIVENIIDCYSIQMIVYLKFLPFIAKAYLPCIYWIISIIKNILNPKTNLVATYPYRTSEIIKYNCRSYHIYLHNHQPDPWILTHGKAWICKNTGHTYKMKLKTSI
jgi:hypothetical protein